MSDRFDDKPLGPHYSKTEIGKLSEAEFRDTPPMKALASLRAWALAHRYAEDKQSDKANEDYDVVKAHIQDLNEKIRSFYDVLKHGDEEHQRWLRNMVNEHFGLED